MDDYRSGQLLIDVAEVPRQVRTPSGFGTVADHFHKLLLRVTAIRFYRRKVCGGRSCSWGLMNTRAGDQGKNGRRVLAIGLAILTSPIARTASAATPTCPTSCGAADSAKPNKIYPY